MGFRMSVGNLTGRYPNSSIQVYIVGTQLFNGRQGAVRRNGQFVPCDEAPTRPDGFADIGIPLSSDGTTDSDFIIPLEFSGRVYFAINAPLKFRVVQAGSARAFQYPSGWTNGDPNFPVLHDFFEFTFNKSGMFCNTTMVDMFSVPLSIELIGEVRTQSTGTLVSGGRDRIFSSIKALSEFSRLVIGDDLRVIAPSHGIEAGRFSASYFDSYVDRVWQRYREQDLAVALGTGGKVTGRVRGDQLQFTDGIAAVRRPSTRDVLFCDGALAAPNDGRSGPVAAVLGAAFNRGTLLDQSSQPTTDPARFYPVNATANHYARVMHENTLDGKAYGFAFDDVAGFASYIEERKPKEIKITLTPFGGTAPPSTRRRDAYGEILCDSFDSQSGTSTEPSSEGGTDVGFIANGDWLEYRDVDFGSRAAKAFSVRVASGVTGGASGFVDVRVDSRAAPPVASIPVQNTGGWQTWRTASADLSSSSSPPVSGTRVIFLTFRSAQPQEFVNVRFFKFSPSPLPPPSPNRDAFTPISAATFNAQFGTQTEPSSEGGLDVGYIASGDWLEYRGVNFGTRTARRFTARVASGAGRGASGLVEVRLGDRAAAPVAVLPVRDTGGWQSWVNVTGDVTSPIFGIQTVFLTFFREEPQLEFVNVLSFTFSD